jgi:hypothetical protein
MSVPYETDVNRTLTEQGSDSNGILIPCQGFATASVQLSGTLAASTVYFEGTVDGTNYVGVLGWNRTTGVKALTAAAVGLYLVNITGLNLFRVRLDWTTADSVTCDVICSSLPIDTLVTAS